MKTGVEEKRRGRKEVERECGGEEKEGRKIRREREEQRAGRGERGKGKRGERERGKMTEHQRGKGRGEQERENCGQQSLSLQALLSKQLLRPTSVFQTDPANRSNNQNCHEELTHVPFFTSCQ